MSLNSATPISSTSSATPSCWLIDLEALGQRTALEPFDGLEDDLAAVQDRNRQQVHEAEREAEDDQEV